MSGNARFHDKLHRANHHTLSTSGILDSAYDPIASPAHPFRGDFILSGSLSALNNVGATNISARNDLNVAGYTNTKSQTIEGNLKLTNANFGGASIYANIPTPRIEPFTLSLNYQNGVYISDNLYVNKDLRVRDLTATGTIWGNMPSAEGFAPSTRDISYAYSNLSKNSAGWVEATNWVASNSSDMVVDNLLVTGNLTALGTSTIVDLYSNTSDALSVVNVGLGVPAIYAEVKLGSLPVLELKHTGSGPILSSFSGGKTFVINNSGWIGIGGEPTLPLDIYALSSYEDGGILKLRGASNSNTDYTIGVEDANLKIANTIDDSTAFAITSTNQVRINANDVAAPYFYDDTYKLFVKGKSFVSAGDPQSFSGPVFVEDIQNSEYKRIYSYDAGTYDGVLTRVFNASGVAAAPLSGFNVPGYYIGWGVRTFPYVNNNTWGNLGWGGVGAIQIGYEGQQSLDSLQGVITFHTLCGTHATALPERMRISPAGNVGIGTTSPQEKLHISSGKNINGHCRVLLEADTDNGTNEDVHAGIFFKQDGGQRLHYIGTWGLPDHNTFQLRASDDISFSNWLVAPGVSLTDVTSAIERFRIRTDGVSILSGDLHVTGNIYGNVLSGNLPPAGGLTPSTQDISNAYTTVYTKSAAWDAASSSAGADLTVRGLTGNWQSTYTTVNTNSSNWNYQGLDLKALSSNWQSTYTTVNTNSSNWNYQGLDLKALSSNWQSTYTTVYTKSAAWDAASSSAGADLTVRGLTGNWQSTYTTVNTKSASWDSTYTTVNTKSASWDSTYTTVNTKSASWDVSNYVKLKSYTETSVVSAISSNNIAIINLAEGTVFPISLDKNITQFELRNIPSGVNSFLATLTQDAVGGRTVTWSFGAGKTIKWSGGAPTMTTTANATDIVSFMSIDGVTWYGSTAGQNFV
jgi:hypothetical protein